MIRRTQTSSNIFHLLIVDHLSLFAFICIKPEHSVNCKIGYLIYSLAAIVEYHKKGSSKLQYE